MNEWTCESDGDDHVRQKESEKSLNAALHWQMNGADIKWKMKEEEMNKQTFEQLTKQANKQTNEWVND